MKKRKKIKEEKNTEKRKRGREEMRKGRMHEGNGFKRQAAG